MRAAPNALHTKGEDTRSFCKYTVYDNRTGLPVIVDGEARECAKAMGISYNGFFSAVTRARTGQVKRWTIITRYLDGKERYEWREKDSPLTLIKQPKNN